MIKNIWQFLSLVLIWGGSTAGALILHDPKVYFAAVIATVVFLVAQNFD